MITQLDLRRDVRVPTYGANDDRSIKLELWDGSIYDNKKILSVTRGYRYRWQAKKAARRINRVLQEIGVPHV